MIVVSVLTYALGKALGIAGAARALARQLLDEHGEVLPCVRTVQRLQMIDELMLYHGASTTLPKARSRAAHAALAAPKADVWIMIDDDVETDLDTLSRIVAVARSGSVVVLPCAVRGTEQDHRVNVLWQDSLIRLVGGVSVRAVARGGCGLMAVPRVALELVRDANSERLTYHDDDGERRVALFEQMFVGGIESQMWLGEDYSFCERLKAAGVDIVAPVEGWSMHDGAVLDLGDASRMPY